ncbi:MAG: glycosyltransferase family 4 protein [Candidatus Eremiobacteraeota bacterium]|nr:glycosyltransferase family 4 protein [Candidatus Eremiobacteraeota bacterium]
MTARVGLDARLTRQMSVGMKAYTTELTSRLPVVAPDLAFTAFTEGANFGLDEQIRLPLAMRRAGVDLAHFMSLYTPVLPPRPYIVTIHDLIHLRFPEFFKSKVGPYYKTVVKFAARHAALVLTDDPRTIGDLEEFLGVNPQKCRVIPLGVDDRFLARITPFRAAQPYFLNVGNHRAHKDLVTLFEAWASLPPELAVDLYLTGADDFGPQLSHYQTAQRQIVVLGDVPPEKLPALYAGAAALVHPALCEGFGLPMLEAMAARTAVVACENAIPRVLESAALTFPARDVQALTIRLERVLADQGLRSALVNEGRKLAEGLTWDRCASQTAALYREVLPRNAG